MCGSVAVELELLDMPCIGIADKGYGDFKITIY